MNPKMIEKGRYYQCRLGRKLVDVVVKDIRQNWDDKGQEVLIYDVWIEEWKTWRSIFANKFRKPLGLPKFNFNTGKTEYIGGK